MTIIAIRSVQMWFNWTSLFSYCSFQEKKKENSKFFGQKNSFLPLNVSSNVACKMSFAYKAKMN